jgi:heme-degrading monooxygenase HmoA
MHVSVTRTHDPLDQPMELATIAGEEMLPWLREIDGFEGLLMLSDASTGTTLVVTFWESEEVAEKHAEARRQFRESITSAVNVNVVDTSGYELAFAHLGAWADEGVDD